MRIGTWNMEGHGKQEQAAFLLEQNCDVLLLTEVKEDFELTEYDLINGDTEMLTGKRWAAVAARRGLALTKCVVQPHDASIAVTVGSKTFVSSILPWKGCGGKAPWKGADHGERMVNTLTPLKEFMSKRKDGLVWGGDWNHSLSGSEVAGSKAGRRALLDLIDELGLAVPTAGLPHRLGCLSIDHIALRGGAREARRVETELSDHDFYMVVVDD